MRLVTGLIVAGLTVASVSAAPTKIVCLGDSITKGVRGGVTTEQTYEAILQGWLSERVAPVEVINVGVGGERTDQALLRLATGVVALNPDYVTIMYGTNDSAVDEGRTEPRLTLTAYRENLHTLVQRLRAAGIRPVLMTSPPWCPARIDTPPGPHRERGPNDLLVSYVRAVRQVSADEAVPLVDNFAVWAEEALLGHDLNALTTDGCHPNPDGHLLIARTMYPVLARLLGGDPTVPGQEAGAPQTQDNGGNLASGRPYAETSHNDYGWDKGLTDGTKDRDGSSGGYGTGDDDVYPKLTTIDLGEPQTVGRVVVHNMGEGNTKAISVGISVDGESFATVGQHEFGQGDAGVYECKLTPAQARYVRISFLDSWLTDSHGSQHFMFLREVEVFAE